MRILPMCLLLLPTLSMAAPAFFVDCEVALENSEFKLLRDHLASAAIQQIDKCMRLTSSEFLLTANRKGPYNGPASNLFYCSLKAPATGCVENEPSFLYPDLTLARQFSGPRGKQYVLWSTQLLRRGVETSGYHIFNLAPKTNAPRGYVFYSLGIGTQLSYNACESSNESDEPGSEITGVEVRGEGTEAVTLEFEQKTRSCQTSSKATQTINFVLKDGRFQKE